MQTLRLRKKAALLGTGLFAAGLFSMPLSGSASAAQHAKTASIGGNAAVNVQAEYNCSTHTLYTDVKNKLDKEITPTVIFDQPMPDAGGYPPLGGSTASIKPGESYKYMFGFSGSNRPINVNVAVDGYEPVRIDPFANCNDVVTFTVTDYSSQMVAGYITNTNPDYPQKVTLSEGFGGQSHDFDLERGESKKVAVPLSGGDESTIAIINVSTGPSYSTSYMVDLTAPIPAPPLPGPKPVESVL